jgi:hypothetical protein
VIAKLASDGSYAFSRAYGPDNGNTAFYVRFNGAGNLFLGGPRGPIISETASLFLIGARYEP